MKLCGALLFFFLTLGAVAQQRPRVNHVALSVSNLERSRIFYQQIIGLDTIPEPFHDARHAWFAMGAGAQLHIIQNPPPLVVPTKNTHVCFSVANMQTFIAGLEKRKLSYEDWPGKPMAITIRPDGVHQIYLQDPDGYWLEVNDDY